MGCGFVKSNLCSRGFGVADCEKYLGYLFEFSVVVFRERVSFVCDVFVVLLLCICWVFDIPVEGRKQASKHYLSDQNNPTGRISRSFSRFKNLSYLLIIDGFC